MPCELYRPICKWSNRLAYFVVSLLMAGTLMAQTSRLTGRVADPSGAPVPAAPITVTNSGTNQSRTTQSSPDGNYELSNLLPGEYSIKVESPGFKPTIEQGIRLQVDQTLEVNLSLQIGGVSEQVVVEARTPILDTESHSVSQTIQGTQVVNLPMLGRNAYSLGALVPGVRVSRGMNDLPVDQISTASISINGAPGNANEFLLDGAPNTAAAQNQPIIYPNADSVQEFRVETNNFSAEYGRAAGGIFNVVTKNGTNVLHGDVYEFLRNDKLNSDDFFANMAGREVPPFKFNQFGGVLGGPVLIPHVYDGRNKTFFFVSAELVRFIQGVTYTATVPDPLQLTGNFSQLKTSAGQPITIYDPASTTLVNGKYTRTAFAGNIIQPNRISPVAAAILKYWPAPNVAAALPEPPTMCELTATTSRRTPSARVSITISPATRACLPAIRTTIRHGPEHRLTGSLI